MNKRSISFGVVALCSVGLVVGVLLASANRPDLLPASANASHILTVDSYEDIHGGTRTANGNAIYFASSGLSSSGGKIALSKGGAIYNTTKLSGIEKVAVTLSSGSVNLYYGQTSFSAWDDGVSGTVYNLEGIYPNFFKVEATSATVIDRIVVTYACHDYQEAAATSGYSVYVNGTKSDATFFEVDKEGNDLQLKAVLDVYPGDVISFDKDGTEIKGSPSGGTNNLYAGDSRGYLMVSDYCKGAHLYLKKNGNAYDAYLSGKGGFMETSPYAKSTILQAFNWSVSTIMSNLDAIARAGYTAIQVSPMQARKYVYKSGSWLDEWWKLYQPDGFFVAQSTDDYDGAIGIASELRSLCAAAKSKGIGIIMDVVLNHLSGGSATSFGGNVREDEIVSENLKHDYGHIPDNPSQEAILRGTYGDYPDLMTESPVVQGRALSLLKEYLDLGVSGFRFDAAKHIETPKDGNYASSFWPYVVNGSRRYAAKKGYDVPYYYGEILGPNDAGRSPGWYTDYMDIADGYLKDDLMQGIEGGKEKIDKISGGYYTEIAMSDHVLWAESHDSYVDSYKGNYVKVEINVNKVYAMQASRAQATALYCARPYDGNTKFGDSGSEAWKDPVVAGANKLHKEYRASSEWLDINKGTPYTYVNSRGSGEDAGSLAVNISNDSGTYSVYFPNLADGSYRDIVTGNEYNVSGNRATIAFGAGGAAVLMPTSSSTFYLVGNTIFTGTSASWNKESGRVMEKSANNLAEIHDIHLEAGAEVKVLRAQDGHADDWVVVNLPSSYDYCEVAGNGNLKFTQAGTYSIFLNAAREYYVSGTPDEQSSSAESSASSPAASLETVYFTNNMHWSTVNVYMWNGNSEENAAWPGEAATRVGTNEYGEDIYRIDLGVYDHIIVNNGSQQTEDIALSDFGSDNAVYLEGDSSPYGVGFWTYVPEQSPSSSEAASSSASSSSMTTTVPSSSSSSSAETESLNTIYITNNHDWADVYVYLWNGAGNNKWPGAKATYSYTNGMGQKIYAFTGIAGYEHLIINNGSGAQTVDIDIEDFGSHNGIWIGGANSQGKYAVGGYWDQA